MIHELRVYTLWPGKVPEFLKLAEERAMKIRGDDYGKLLGYWFSEFGPLNQVFHLWEYADLNARQEARAGLGKNEEWRRDYVAHVQPLMRNQEIRLMNPQKPIGNIQGSGNIYEFRHYKARIGKAPAFLKNFVDIMPVREKYSPNVGIWHTEAALPNELSHMWAYPSLNARFEIRAEQAKDKDWQAFLKENGAYLEEMHSSVLIPAAFSPLR